MLKENLKISKMNEETHLIGPFTIIRLIGGGNSSKVKLGQNTQTGQLVAIKIIKKSSYIGQPHLEKKVKREIALLKLVDHPHILSLVDIYESQRHLYIISEYASKGELFNLISDKKLLDESEAANFFRQLIYGIEYLHSFGICHRDIKPENLLLDDHNNIKIADFGFARFAKENAAETSCGSPHYAAPEVLSGHPYDGRAADIWSCGVVLFTLLTVCIFSIYSIHKKEKN